MLPCVPHGSVLSLVIKFLIEIRLVELGLRVFTQVGIKRLVSQPTRHFRCSQTFIIGLGFFEKLGIRLKILLSMPVPRPIHLLPILRCLIK